MKLTSLLLISILFFVLGCSTKNSEQVIEPEKYNKEQIIENLIAGEWQWIYTTGIPYKVEGGYRYFARADSSTYTRKLYADKKGTITLTMEGLYRTGFDELVSINQRDTFLIHSLETARTTKQKAYLYAISKTMPFSLISVTNNQKQDTLCIAFYYESGRLYFIRNQN